MGLLDSILGGDNSRAIGAIAKQLGIPEETAKQGASSLIPALSRGVQREAATPTGLEGLLGALSSGNHERYLSDPSSLGQASSIADGNAILGHIFGSKDVSRNVAANASQKTGISPDILKQLLPMLAPLVMAMLSKQAAGTVSDSSGGLGGLGDLGGLGGLLGGLLGGNKAGLADAGGAIGAAGLMKFLDQDNDGDPMDDILDLVKKYGG